jgi:hypothetical protein
VSDKAAGFIYNTNESAATNETANILIVKFWLVYRKESTALNLSKFLEGINFRTDYRLQNPEAYGRTASKLSLLS